MTKTTSIALMVAGLILGSGPSAGAQTPPPSKNIFVDFSFGVQPQTRSFSISATPLVYGELAIIRGTQDIDRSGLIDVTAGYRVWRNVAVALSLSSTAMGGGTATITGGIPHPIFFDRRIESTVEVTDVAHREQAAHLAFMWTSPISDKVDASIFGGPSYVKIFQDVISDVVVPAGTQTFTPVAAVEQTATKLGVHVGGDVTFLITPHIGVGGMARFVKVKLDLPVAAELDAAGFQAGGGVRIRF